MFAVASSSQLGSSLRYGADFTLSAHFSRKPAFAEDQDDELPTKRMRGPIAPQVRDSRIADLRRVNQRRGY